MAIIVIKILRYRLRQLNVVIKILRLYNEVVVNSAISFWGCKCLCDKIIEKVFSICFLPDLDDMSSYFANITVRVNFIKYLLTLSQG